MESCFERNRPNAIGSISKSERLVRLSKTKAKTRLKNKRNRLCPPSPMPRARAIRKRLLTKNLVVIDLDVIDASHHRLSLR
jgi:hypothetical protein